MAQKDSQNSKKTIIGKIEKVIFLDTKSGRSIVSVLQEDGKSCRVIGNINGIEKDSKISAKGSWRKDERYGWQFLAESIEMVLQSEEVYEPIEDGLMHALDFSNVLCKRYKEFRNVVSDFEDDIEDEDWEDEPCPTIELSQNKGQDNKQKNVAEKVRALASQRPIVPSIGAYAYLGNKDKSIYIPEDIQNIDYRAFEDCSNLEEIIVDERNEYYKSIDGVLYNHEVNRILWVPLAKTSVVLPETITRIDDGDFEKREQLLSVKIPESVTSIGAYAFYGCKKLVDISIPKSVKTIGMGAFDGCDSLNHLLLQEPMKDENAADKPIIKEKTLNIDWNEVIFQFGFISVPDQEGRRIVIKDSKLNSSLNSLRNHLAKMLPYLIVHVDNNGTPSIVNAKELHDAVIILKIKTDLASLIREGYKSMDILHLIDEQSKKQNVYVPRDVTPYINFLLEKHAADKYPVVPIVEYIGGSKEYGALYTIMIEGQPNIVWENNKDSRCTYVFSCTEEDYIETRQLVFDYVMAEEKGKRKLLHTDKCLTIFKEKPRVVVHNNLTSWAQRLMCNPELVVASDLLSKSTIREKSQCSGNGEYVTHIEITEIEGECEDADWQECTIRATAFVEVKYNKLIDDCEHNLLTCTFHAYTSIIAEFDEMNEFEIEDYIEEDNVSDRVAELTIEDFDGLGELDLQAQGVPTNGEGLSSDDIGKALAKALDACGIDWGCGDFECSKLFASNELTGDFDS